MVTKTKDDYMSQEAWYRCECGRLVVLPTTIPPPLGVGSVKHQKHCPENPKNKKEEVDRKNDY
jgi:hypothetical protein